MEFERDIAEVQQQIDLLVASAERSGFDVSADLKELRANLDALKQSTYQNLTPIEQVQVARHHERPYTLDYIERISPTGSSFTGTVPSETTRRSWVGGPASTGSP